MMPRSFRGIAWTSMTLAVTLLPARGRAQETGRPTPVVTAATSMVDRLARGDFSGATARFDSTMTAVMPPPKLEEVWRTVEQQAGPFVAWTRTRTGSVQGYDVVTVIGAFARDTIDIRVVFDQNGSIAGLFFRPHRKAPDRSAAVVPAPAAVAEREVTVGDGEWRLPGTLTTPSRGSGPFPVVVLVHGSGPNDRDETIGPNKPFRDLAWGLGSRGVAVLRYEKRTRQYRERLITHVGRFTVAEETVDDALAAVALVRNLSTIDPDRVFVLGHSLGGMLAPRIARRDERIAGLIMLAGAARPLEDLIGDQVHYLAGLDSAITDAERVRLEQIEQEMARVAALTPADSSSGDLILGAPASYWLDLRAYDPVAVARSLSIPMLILQGGRDYQVTGADLARWRDGLAGSPRVSFREYSELNHLFIAGAGPSSPAEYETVGHVAPEVVADIAAWIESLKGD